MVALFNFELKELNKDSMEREQVDLAPQFIEKVEDLCCVPLSTSSGPIAGHVLDVSPLRYACSKSLTDLCTLSFLTDGDLFTRIRCEGAENQ